MVESTVGHQEWGKDTDCKRLFLSTLNAVIGEMSEEFSERNSQQVCALDPESLDFLDVKKVKPLLDLS